MMIKTKNRTICGFSVGDKFKVKEPHPWDAFENPIIEIIESRSKSKVKYIYLSGDLKGESHTHPLDYLISQMHKLERI